MATAILTLEQAAEYLQLHIATVRRLAQQGRIPCRKVGQQWRFSRAALESYVKGATGMSIVEQVEQHEEQVLDTLEKIGFASLAELAQETGLDETLVRRIMVKAVNTGVELRQDATWSGSFSGWVEECPEGYRWVIVEEDPERDAPVGS